jgi:hypothetical protein
MPKAPIEE